MALRSDTGPSANSVPPCNMIALTRTCKNQHAAHGCPRDVQHQSWSGLWLSAVASYELPEFDSFTVIRLNHAASWL
jgi:hypothetical protein